MKRRARLELGEILIIVAIIGILAAIIIPAFVEPKITVHIGNIKGEPGLIYTVPDRYGFKKIYFRDIGFDGDLDSIKADGVVLDPNTVTPRSGQSVGWDTWLERFENEVRPQATKSDFGS